MRILLIGIGGVYNYGCEAIVRGTVAIIKSKYPDAKIVYASYRRNSDNNRLKDVDIEIVSILRHGKYSIKNLTRKVFSLFGIKIPLLENMIKLKNFKNFDIVMSIGGDLYTLNSNGEYPLGLIQLGDMIIKKGIKYIIWGASIGPFSNNKKAELSIIKHLKKCNKVVLRENNSFEYLKQFKLNNIYISPDPAFSVLNKNDFEINSSGLLIGINFSPLSIRYLQLKDDIDLFITKQVEFIENLIVRYDSDILLIPHVWCDWNKSDDDYRYLDLIYHKIKNKYSFRVKLVKEDSGFIGIKEYLINCDIVIAARMHCAINAISLSIPTMFLSYSSKAVGMCEYVYDTNNWVKPLNDVTNNMIFISIDDMLTHKQDIRNKLMFKNQGFKNRSIKDIEKILI